MVEDIYEKLAQKLDAHPSGFPRTESGIELILLKKIFTPDEAALANDLQLMPETVAQIAGRAGRDPAKTAEMLQTMVGKGQIMGFPMGEDFAFMLLPFIVGIYFFQVPSLDEEFAQLFEEYYKSWAEGSFSTAPTYHRIVSIDQSVPVELEVSPYERVTELLKDARSFALYPCMCKLQKKFIDGGCDHPTNTCLIYSQGEGAFDNMPGMQVLTREEAFKALRDFEDAGLVHTMGNFREPNPGMDFICSCCTHACTFLRGLAELGIKNSIAKTNFYSVVNNELCDDCSECLDRCQFGALSKEDNVYLVDRQKCAGCGLCVARCTPGALKLMRKSEDESVHTPRNIQEWGMERAKNRGLG